jgi:hypothetical protein
MLGPICCKSYNVNGDHQILIFLLVQKNINSLLPLYTWFLTSIPAEIWFFKSSDRGCRTKGPLPNLRRLTVHRVPEGDTSRGPYLPCKIYSLALACIRVIIHLRFFAPAMIEPTYMRSAMQVFQIFATRRFRDIYFWTSLGYYWRLIYKVRIIWQIFWNFFNEELDITAGFEFEHYNLFFSYKSNLSCPVEGYFEMSEQTDYTIRGTSV